MDANIDFEEYCKKIQQQYQPNKRVLLIQIPQLLLSSFRADVAQKKGYYAFPPTGLQYLYESLKTRGLSFQILDLNFEILKRASTDHEFDCRAWLKILAQKIQEFQPGVVGVSCMFDAGIQPLIQVLEYLKQVDLSVVIAGGVIASYEWKNLLSRGLCHFVIKGEGENRVNYLFDKLTNEDRGFPATGGICFRSADTLGETTGSSDTVSFNTDLIDSYSLVPVEIYYRLGSLNPFSRMAGLASSPFAAIQMNRGCRGACTFCSVRSFMGKGVRRRSVEKILAEMSFLVEQRGIRHFEWLDDDLLCYKEEFQQLLQSIINKDWQISWAANNGLIAASIDEQTLRLMRDSGCIGFKIGIETGNAEMLKKVKKPASLSVFRRSAKLLADYPEIFVGGNFIVGLPEENFGQMLDSFHFFLELQLDWGAFTVCQAIRGATAFDDFGDYFMEQMDSGGQDIHNFIPVRESKSGQIDTDDSIKRGMGVFDLALEQVPSEAQVMEIWFTFNLVGNFIYNKNLFPGGEPDKFISWVEMAQVAYPTNPYMCFFLAIAYLLKDEPGRARSYCQEAVNSVDSDYWQQKLSTFGILEALERFPEKKEDVWGTLKFLRELTGKGACSEKKSKDLLDAVSDLG